MARNFTSATDQLIAAAAMNPTQYTIALFFTPNAGAGTGGGTNTKAVSCNLVDGSVDLGFSYDHSSSDYQQAWYHRSGVDYPVAKYTTTLSGGTRYHTAGTYDGSNIRAYLNGAVEATAAASNPNTSASSQFALGNPVIVAEAAAVCACAELGIWNVALTTAEVASLAKGYIPPLIRPASLLYYIPMIRDNVAPFGVAWTLTGTSVVAHAPIIESKRRMFRYPGDVTAATGKPWHYYQQMMGA